MAGAIGGIMDGAATPAQIGVFLMALRTKGPRPSTKSSAPPPRCARCARTLRVPPGIVVDTCGTGGDGRGTSHVLHDSRPWWCGRTLGVRVAKHGNRAQVVTRRLRRRARGARPTTSRRRWPSSSAASTKSASVFCSHRFFTAPPRTSPPRARSSGCAHHLQPARPADPIRRAPATSSSERVGRGLDRADGARGSDVLGCAHALSGARRRPLRVFAARRHRRMRARRRRDSQLTNCIRATSASTRPIPRGSPAATPRSTPKSRAAIFEWHTWRRSQTPSS